MLEIWQAVLLFVLTEILLYKLAMDALATIRHCATARAYSKLKNNGVNFSYDEFASAVQNKTNNNIKEENENGTNN